MAVLSNRMKRWILPLVAGLALTPADVFAQDSGNDADELNIIEVELEKAVAPSSPAPRNPRTEPNDAQAIPPEVAAPMDFSGLGQLAPFSEVSVLQKRFLPKTGRFQLFGGLTMVTNDPFFNVFGAVGKASYFFTEAWGVEFNYFGLTTSEAKATQELRQVQGILTESLVQTKGVMALDLVYVPIYGKMTWFNEKIIPFDLYFSVGGGTTQTDREDAPTLHLATGQIFALSKSTALRWDFSWNFFNATTSDGNTSSYNNLFVTVGWSWFFPEAKYR